MSSLSGMAFLDIGYTNVNEDLKSCICYDKSGDQDVVKTISNYIELLNKAIGVLTILRDGISSKESKNIHLFSECDELGINGSQELIDRFVGFGIANPSDDWSDEESYDDEYEDESDSDSDSDDNKSN